MPYWPTNNEIIPWDLVLRPKIFFGPDEAFVNDSGKRCIYSWFMAVYRDHHFPTMVLPVISFVWAARHEKEPWLRSEWSIFIFISSLSPLFSASPSIDSEILPALHPSSSPSFAPPSDIAGKGKNTLGSPSLSSCRFSFRSIMTQCLSNTTQSSPPLLLFHISLLPPSFSLSFLFPPSSLLPPSFFASGPTPLGTHSSGPLVGARPVLPLKKPNKPLKPATAPKPAAKPQFPSPTSFQPHPAKSPFPSPSSPQPSSSSSLPVGTTPQDAPGFPVKRPGKIRHLASPTRKLEAILFHSMLSLSFLRLSSECLRENSFVKASSSLDL